MPAATDRSHRSAPRQTAWGAATAACVLLSGLSLPAQAKENWVEVATTATRTVLLDTDSVRPHGDKLEAWTQSRYNEKQNDVGKTPFDRSKVLYDFDCKAARVKSRRMITYNGPLEGLDLDIGRKSEWLDTGKPTTVSSILMRQVCPADKR